MFKKVLVPLDGTDIAEGILLYVSQVAGGLGIPVVLLSVIEPSALAMPDHASGEPGQSPHPDMFTAGVVVGSEVAGGPVPEEPLAARPARPAPLMPPRLSRECTRSSRDTYSRWPRG
jgi:nucleotide-binding universal stress UspA family protein